MLILDRLEPIQFGSKLRIGVVPISTGVDPIIRRTSKFHKLRRVHVIGPALVGKETVRRTQQPRSALLRVLAIIIGTFRHIPTVAIVGPVGPQHNGSIGRIVLDTLRHLGDAVPAILGLIKDRIGHVFQIEKDTVVLDPFKDSGVGQFGRGRHFDIDVKRTIAIPGTDKANAVLQFGNGRLRIGRIDHIRIVFVGRPVPSIQCHWQSIPTNKRN